MRILLNGLTQRPGGGMVVLQGLVSGIANASKTDELVVIVYDRVVNECLSALGFDNVRVIQIDKVIDLVDKFSVPFRVRTSMMKYRSDVLITLNFHVPFVSIPQIVYHVDLERFESHSIFPLSVHNLLEKIRDNSSKRALRNADANVFESKYVFNAAEAHSKCDIRNPSVIYIGVDNKNIKQKNSTDKSIDEGLVVAVTSPLPYKYNQALVPIVVGLVDRAPEINWRIRLFGGIDSSAWTDLIELAEAADVLGRFEFMGFQTHSVLNNSLDIAVCKLSTSRLESFCMVALEAMSRACPVIVSGDAAMPESVGDAGIILDPDETDAIVDRIIRLNCVTDGRLILKQKSIMWASQHTWEHSGKSFRELCNNLCVN